MQALEKQGVQGGDDGDAGEDQYRIETEEDLELDEDDLEPPFMIAV